MPADNHINSEAAATNNEEMIEPIKRRGEDSEVGGLQEQIRAAFELLSDVHELSAGPENVFAEGGTMVFGF